MALTTGRTRNNLSHAADALHELLKVMKPEQHGHVGSSSVLRGAGAGLAGARGGGSSSSVAPVHVGQGAHSYTSAKPFPAHVAAKTRHAAPAKISGSSSTPSLGATPTNAADKRGKLPLGPPPRVAAEGPASPRGAQACAQAAADRERLSRDASQPSLRKAPGVFTGATAVFSSYSTSEQQKQDVATLMSKLITPRSPLRLLTKSPMRSDSRPPSGKKAEEAANDNSACGAAAKGSRPSSSKSAKGSRPSSSKSAKGSRPSSSKSAKGSRPGSAKSAKGSSKVAPESPAGAAQQKKTPKTQEPSMWSKDFQLSPVSEILNLSDDTDPSDGHIPSMLAGSPADREAKQSNDSFLSGINASFILADEEDAGITNEKTDADSNKGPSPVNVEFALFSDHRRWESEHRTPTSAKDAQAPSTDAEQGEAAKVKEQHDTSLDEAVKAVLEQATQPAPEKVDQASSPVGDALHMSLDAGTQVSETEPTKVDQASSPVGEALNRTVDAGTQPEPEQALQTSLDAGTQVSEPEQAKDEEPSEPLVATLKLSLDACPQASESETADQTETPKDASLIQSEASELEFPKRQCVTQFLQEVVDEGIEALQPKAEVVAQSEPNSVNEVSLNELVVLKDNLNSSRLERMGKSNEASPQKEDDLANTSKLSKTSEVAIQTSIQLVPTMTDVLLCSREGWRKKDSDASMSERPAEPQEPPPAQSWSKAGLAAMDSPKAEEPSTEAEPMDDAEDDLEDETDSEGEDDVEDDEEECSEDEGADEVNYGSLGLAIETNFPMTTTKSGRPPLGASLAQMMSRRPISRGSRPVSRSGLSTPYGASPMGERTKLLAENSALMNELDELLCYTPLWTPAASRQNSPKKSLVALAEEEN